MAQYSARIAPFINVQFVITAAQPYYSDGSLHGGLDISTGRNDPVYSMVNGTVLYSQWNSGGYGNCIITRDTTTGDSFLYGHLKDLPFKRVGETVTVGEFLGYEGTTGQSTGIHLHVEWQIIPSGSSWNWNIPKRDRPHVADFMGIPNTRGITAIYNGTPGPLPPKPGPDEPILFKKSTFPWAIYLGKFRNNNR